ncbi:oligosaccharide flippase family protein [Catenisphaera adipataccumulans]|jgi:O-antigen/teichoic acid export membrane protein|uniref:O-antigen/teichoic acid export membrane protein n=1 Tax=Catenisphaera adipataccumulans TaxID=700500 RepID=A0A7W8FUB8_9FIRM|nr:oligosaccharide flippase family protein [Catenisphaera adipataccumulans]MBB5182424.1 O-antigen/teichoic acid export membrane protein [Catenisphaera adipataccumulans]
MPDTSQDSKIKKSVILSGLVGTGGLFVAKLIGIIYAIPFSSILSNVDYMGYYGQAYNIYSYVLNIFTAGFPFAIATMVSKYMTLNDPKTVQLVKKISLNMLMLMGFVGMVLLMAFSGVIAPLMVATGAETMARVLRILALAIFLVPTLSAFRGYYEGQKEMKEYAYSQVFEQFFRVGFLLGAACLLVYVMHWARVWALYASVLSTSVAALAGILQIRHFDKKADADVKEQARRQTTPSKSKKEITRELFRLALPYMLVSIVGYSQQIYNAILLPTGLKMFYSNTDIISSIISATTYVGTKITAIPMVLAPGFVAAIIPHVTSALTEKNQKLVRKNVVDCLTAVLYIGLPVCMCIFVYAEPINYTLFYTDDLSTSTMVLQWMTIEALTGTFSPVVTNLMMALGLRRSNIRNICINAVVKGILMVPFTAMWGFGGAVIASFIADGWVIWASLHEIRHKFHIRYNRIFQVVLRTLIGCLVLWGVSYALTRLGLGGVGDGKMISFVKMCFNGLISLIAFMAVTIALKVPQLALHMKFGLPKRRQS